MESNSLTDQEKEILDKLKENFFERVTDEKKHFNAEYFWKWSYTWIFAKKLKMDTKLLRKVLNSLEIKGYVHSKRTSNSIGWAVNKIEGFKEGQFVDYYYPETPK